MVILQNMPFVRCMRLKAENIFIYLCIPSGALHIYVYISAFFSSAESFMIDDRWSNTTMDVCRWPTDAGAAMGICRISSIVFYAFFSDVLFASCLYLFFFYYYYFNVCKQASIIDEAPFLCRHELMYVFMYDISQMSRCAVYICRRLSIRIIRFVFQDPGETKWGRGREREAVSCFRGRKPPLCHNNDFVLWSPVTYGFEHKQRWVKNYTMLLFCHCPVYVSYTDCITERWPFIHVSFVYFFYFLCMFNPEIRKFFFGHWRLKIHFSRVCLFFFHVHICQRNGLFVRNLFILVFTYLLNA